MAYQLIVIISYLVLIYMSNLSKRACFKKTDWNFTY